MAKFLEAIEAKVHRNEYRNPHGELEYKNADYELDWVGMG